MNITFDESGAEFVLKAFGFSIEKELGGDKDAIWVQNSRGQCCKCLKHLSLHNLGGITKHNGYLDGPALICDDEKCLSKL